jgi:ATP-binding cassette subfamily G (WHITE) protein 2 (PDR)
MRSVEEPCRVILNVISNAEDAQSTSQNRITQWNELWALSIEREEILRQIAAFKESPVRDKDAGALSHERRYAASFMTQLFVVTRRLFQDYWRDPVCLYCKGALCVITVSKHLLPGKPTLTRYRRY